MQRDSRRRAAILSAFLLAGCRAGGGERIDLATVHLPALGLVFIAQEKGYFAAHGLTVVQRRYSSGRDALTALEEGLVDAATALETPVVLRAARDPELEIMTTLHVSTRNTRLVGRADRGIARPTDLVGKKVGVPEGTSAVFFLHTLLAYAGVAEERVRIVNLEPETAPAALAAGEVDAIVIWQPLAEQARRTIGAERSVEMGSDVHTEISTLLTLDPVHQRRRPALIALVRGLADAERLVREHPAEAFASLRREFPEMSEAELRDQWSKIRPQLGLTHQLAAVLESESYWFHATGRLRGEGLDLGRILDPDVLSAVDPEAVTFVSPARGKTAR